MKTLRPILPVVLLLTVVVHGAGVELSDRVRDNFGITTVSVASSKVAQRWQATAQVLDASVLAATVSDLRAAQIAGAASSSELKRVEVLQQADNASLKVLEAARSLAAADRSKVQTLRAQLLGTWGAAIARMPDASLDALVQRILAGQVVLARVEVAGNAAPNRSGAVRVNLPDALRSTSGQLLGAMPQRADQTIGHAWLVSVQTNGDPSSEQDWQTGQTLSVELQDASRSTVGFAVPRSAIVRWQGQNWVYVEQEDVNHFLRKAVQIAQSQEQSVLIASGLAAGDKVVTVGAGLLLGAELAPPEEEEEGEQPDTAAKSGDKAE